MLAFILRRILQAAAVMLTVALLAFVLFQYVGDPVTIMLGQDATDAERVELRERLGLDDAPPVQFARFVGNALQGDFGISLRQSEKVSSLIQARLPATLELSLVAAVLALVVGLPLGVYTALRRHGLLAQLVLAGSLLGVSLPTFLIGILLILVFSVQLGWLPSYGRGDTVSFGWWTSGLFTATGWKHLILPSITLSLFQMTLVLRLGRSEMLEVLRSDYIKFARARGLRQRAIHFGHALKNTMVPVITITGLQLGGIIAFAIVTETVFQWPGMGLLFIQAVQFADVPVMAAYLCLIALVFVVINLIVDLLYFVVDPRLRSGLSRNGSAARPGPAGWRDGCCMAARTEARLPQNPPDACPLSDGVYRRCGRDRRRRPRPRRPRRLRRRPAAARLRSARTAAHR
ncbi:binding-protein-dependent permease [Bordetella pertussis]|nr:binding-protein-dependent permease [Bordetella pertussis]CPQ02175.1 binding-protein-dependent permease [Bordetella pertussis]